MRVTLDANLSPRLASTKVFDLKEKDAAQDEVKIEAVLRWLSAHPTWLMILDNVDDEKAVAEVNRLMARLQHGHVIVTGRASNFPGVRCASSNSMCLKRTSRPHSFWIAQVTTECDPPTIPLKRARSPARELLAVLRSRARNQAAALHRQQEKAVIMALRAISNCGVRGRGEVVRSAGSIQTLSPMAAIRALPRHGRRRLIASLRRAVACSD